jgi:hypothetical protein
MFVPLPALEISRRNRDVGIGSIDRAHVTMAPDPCIAKAAGSGARATIASALHSVKPRI